MEREDLKIVNRIKNKRKKYPNSVFFVASKRGGNANGIGSDRSVILAKIYNDKYFQFHKVWGENNEERAKNIIKLSLLK
jgi:hypothetical protein